MLDLINEILHLARIESGKLSLSLEPVGLTEVMIECQTMIGSQAQKRVITVANEQLAFPYFVTADRSGEPMFNQADRFTGYRGIGVEIFAKKVGQWARL